MRTKFGFFLGFNLVLHVFALLFTSIISISSGSDVLESTLPHVFAAPAPEPESGTSLATDPSEVAVLRAIPAISWTLAAANDPCLPPSTWPGVTCVLQNQSSLPPVYHVSRIDLSHDTPQALSILLSVASQLGYLQSLAVTRTTSSLSPSFSISISESIGQLQQLRQLDLSDNGLHLGGPIPVRLASIRKLRRLRLAGNQFTGSIPEDLCKLLSLEYLDLSRNQLQGVIPACLGNSSSLRALNLGSNRLQSRIPAELGQLSSLLYLNLENNRIEGEVPESLGSLTSLRTLRCGRNMLRGVLPSQLGQAQNLQMLDFSLNFDISGSIPSSLGNLSGLVELSLFSMKLNGTIPRELGKLHNLSALRLHSNSISGSIPSSFSQLSNLKILQLQGNQLSGSLPGSVFERLSSLQGLYLQINSFTGVLPVEITRMSSLSVLNLGFNQLHGELPEKLGSLSSLEWLLLGSNRFSGQIPASLGELPRLQLLDLSNNLLVGSVPSTILEAVSIEKNLQFNQLNSTGLLHNLCLTPCSPSSQSSEQYHSPNVTSNRISDSFAINAGGPERILTSRHLVFQADDVFANTSVGFFLGNPTCSASSASWAISLSGSTPSSRIISTNNSSFVEASQELYRTARVGGDSIAYYGRCLRRGSYVVELHFVELENSTVDSPGRRVFDVFLQEQLVHKKLDVLRVAGGPFVPLVLRYQAQVGEESSTLKLELRGTGSWNTSGDSGSYHGPIISAIRVYGNATSSLGISGNSSSSSNMSRELWAILGTSIGILAIVCIALFLGLTYWLRRAEKRARMIREEHTGGDEEISISIDQVHHSLSKSNPATLATFEFSDLEAATQSFSSDNLLGQGAHGRVYKGVLPDGKIVAIKQLVHRTPTCQRWFYHELQVISSVRHRNLVPLIGCCIDRGFPLLVCEFMPNGSLQGALFERDSGIFLTWERRLQIALDVARGLQYLHEDCDKVTIIHRDVKPGNILLDEEMRAHISDFGVAKLIADHEEPEIVVSSVMGTRGYLAPEYLMNGQLSEKVDVYSYGIVLLELVSGRRGMQSSMKAGAPEPVSIDEWAWEALGSNKIEALADPRFGRRYSLDEMVRIVQIAMWCTQGLPEQRPSMGQVVAMLVLQLGVPELPSERISWEEFKSVLEFGGKIGATTSSIWETMNGSYQTANDATLPDLREEQEEKKVEEGTDHSFLIVAPPPSTELEAGSTVSSSGRKN